jgi:ParB-like chromosome segregation protein Spo0J
MEQTEFTEQMDIRNLVSDLVELISEIKDSDLKIETINYVRQQIHEVSPLKHHPVDFVAWVKSDDVEANEYNPNAVAPPEMKLLYESILNDGYTMPIVSYKESDNIKIVDGFHRRETERRNKDISDSTFGRVPVTDIRRSQTDTSNRMASTIRHNRARGSHNIELMSQIVSELVEMGKGDPWICKHIGMSPDELLRMKQITGLASLFLNKEFNKSWEAKDVDLIIEENEAL